MKDRGPTYEVRRVHPKEVDKLRRAGVTLPDDAEVLRISRVKEDPQPFTRIVWPNNFGNDVPATVIMDFETESRSDWVIEGDVLADGRVVRIEVRPRVNAATNGQITRRMLQEVSPDALVRAVRRAARRYADEPPHKPPSRRRSKGPEATRVRAVRRKVDAQKSRIADAVPEPRDVMLARLSIRHQDLYESGAGALRKTLAEEFNRTENEVRTLVAEAQRKGLWESFGHGKRGGRATAKAWDLVTEADT